VNGGVTNDVEAEQTHEQEARPEPSQRKDGATILSTHGLTKDFGKLRAVDGLDMEVCAGDVFGFLGPNGAGKTTVIRLVLGLIHPTSGYAEVAGHRVPGELKEALRHVGGFVDDPTFYPLMSARRNLRLLGSMTGPVSEERIAEVLEIAGLSDRADSRVGGFSHGMKQRLGIAQALLHAPELVVLDEPTSGLDPRGMKDVRELVRDLGRSGVTVFLSSHLLHEVQQVCTRAVIIDRGRVVVQGPVAELRPQGLAVKVMTDDQTKAAATARAMFGARAVSEDDGYLVVQAGDDVPELVRRLVADDLAVSSIIPAADQGLEDYFLELTARGMRPPEKELPEPAEQTTSTEEKGPTEQATCAGEDEPPEQPAGESGPAPPEASLLHAEPAPPEDAAPPEAAASIGRASPDEQEVVSEDRAADPAPAAEETSPAAGPRVTIAVERPGGAGQLETRVLRPAGAGDGSPPVGADEASPASPADFAPPLADCAAPPPADGSATPPVDRAQPAAADRPAPGLVYRAAPPSTSRAPRSPASRALSVPVYRAAPVSPPGPAASASSGVQSIDGRRR
jgi:ABC-2 type transport system ATP-binding protein